MLICLFSRLLFPAQNDHPTTDGQTEDPAEQSQGVPPEIHPAVFLNFHLCVPSTHRGGMLPISTKVIANKNFIVTNKCLSYTGSGGLCDDALWPLHLSPLDICGPYSQGTVRTTKPNWKLNESDLCQFWCTNCASSIVCGVGWGVTF